MSKTLEENATNIKNLFRKTIVDLNKHKEAIQKEIYFAKVSSGIVERKCFKNF